MAIAQNYNEAIRKIAENINKRRRAEIFKFFFENTDFSKYIQEVKKSGINKKRQGKAHWRKIASMPTEVDEFFQKIYGKNYYKDKDFFIKHAPEWMTLTPEDFKKY